MEKSGNKRTEREEKEMMNWASSKQERVGTRH